MENNKSETNKSNWIWGIFYYNKNDDRIFPPKRIPWMGWTINFAKPKSIIVSTLAIAAFLILLKFVIQKV